jgi:hypothetical protein
VDKPAEGHTSRFSAWISRGKQQQKKYQDKLEKHPLTSFPIESFRRFNKIEGQHLAIVIALNLFVAVIPLGAQGGPGRGGPDGRAVRRDQRVAGRCHR